MITLDVRYKMLLLALVSFTTFFVKDLLYGGILFLVVCLLSLSLGQKKTTGQYILLYIGLAALQFLTPYMPKLLQGLLLMTVLCARMFMPLLLYARSFAATTAVGEMIGALHVMKAPRGLTITLAVALRFFPTAKEELRLIRDAMRLRGIGFSPRNLIRRPGLLFEGMLVPLMVRASTVADELSAASITRGIDSPESRSSFTQLRITARDTAVFAVSALLVCGTAAVKYILK